MINYGNKNQGKERYVLDPGINAKTIIMIAHRLSTIEKCDHIYRVENGAIVRER